MTTSIQVFPATSGAGKARRSVLLLLGALAILGLEQTTLRADSLRHGLDPRLEGSWDVTITEWGPAPTQFRILRTVTSAAIVDSYAFPSLSLTPSGLVNSSGHGAWTRTGRRRYSATVKYFQLNYTLAAVPPTIVDTIGTIRERITVSWDGSSYTSEFVLTTTLADGTVVLTNAGKTSAKRILVEPLP